MNRLLFPAVTWLVAIPLQAAEQQPAAPPAPLAIASTANQPVNMFYLDEVGRGGANPIKLTGNLVNQTDKPLDAQAQWEIIGFDGSRQLLGKRSNLKLAPAGDQEKRDRAELKIEWQPERTGFFSAWLRVKAGSIATNHLHALAVVWPPAQGKRPDSLFGTNNPWQPDAPMQCERIGIKIARNPHMACVSPKKGEWNWAAADKDFDRFEERGLVMFPILGYAPPWNVSEPPAGVRKMYGPPADLDAWAELCRLTAERYKGRVVAYEVWNEPWIHSWTWHGTAAEFRRLLEITYRSIKSVDPEVEVLCGHSASFLNDIIAVEGGERFLDGETNHPYKNPPPEHVFLKYTDYGIQTGNWLAKQQKRTWSHWITEEGNGKPWQSDQVWVENVPRKHAIAALLGERCVMWHEIGGHENWDSGMGLYYRGSAQIEPRPAAAAYAVMTHFLEDHQFARDVWPELTSLWGVVFDERAGRDRVAVVWSVAGDAQFTIPDDSKVNAFDIMGNPTGKRGRGGLTFQVGEACVYLTTSLSTEELVSRLRSAKIEGLPAVVLNIKSFTAPIAAQPSLQVKIQNRLNVPVRGELALRGPKGFTFEPKRGTVELQPGETQDVAYQLTSGQPSAENQYPVVATFTSPGNKPVAQSQVVAVACARRGTPAIDGNLDDWTDAIPVTVDESMNSDAAAWTQWALNPGSKKPAAAPGRVSAKFYTMWDDQNFYVAALVRDAKHSPTGSGGLDEYRFAWSGDSIQVLFGFRDRTEWDEQYNPRPPDDPWYWKGNFWDTDYQYALGDGQRDDGTAVGPVLIRLEKPGMPWRVYYPTSPMPGYGRTGFPVKVVRDEAAKTTIYEAAIPWSELALAQPAPGRHFRFTFALNDDGAGNRIQWSRVAGTWPWLQNSCSIHPTWNSDVWPCQTDWALGE